MGTLIYRIPPIVTRPSLAKATQLERAPDRARIGAAIVAVCYEIRRLIITFAHTHAGTFNPAIWSEPDEDDGRTLKPGVRPSEAILDIFRNKKEYAFECGTAVVIIMYKAILDLIGAKDFDAAFPNLRVGPWQYESRLRSLFRSWNRYESGSPYIEATPEDRARPQPGDYAYFQNWDVSPMGIEAGMTGENVIYLGDGLFYGHPFGITTEEGIVRNLNLFRKAGGRSASLTQRRTSLDSRVLELDVSPE